MEWHPPRRKTFPLTANEPFNFLNLDLYAQDTWKVTRTLTWTFGVRDTFNSNPLNPHDQVARLRGSFDSISHDVNQPLNAAIQTHLGNLFSSTPLAILQPRTAIAWQFEPKTVLRTGFGIFSDILPGSVADLIGTNPPYVQTFQGGSAWQPWAARPSRPECRTARWTQPWPRIRLLVRDFRKASFRAHLRRQIPATCLPPVAITAVPDGELHAPYFMEWSLGSNISSEPRPVCKRNTSARAP